MMLRYLVRTLLCSAVFLSPEISLASSPTFAPSTSVVLQGTITDVSGAAIPGAAISIEAEDGAQIATVVADSLGHYEIKGVLQAGHRYRERITAAGFQTTVVDDLSGDATRAKTEDIKLAVGSSTETVNVTADEVIGNGQVATNAQIGMLGSLSTFETPFSVSSYTDQMVRDQQAQTISEVLRNEPGLQDANGRYSEDSFLQLRGFALNVGASLLNGIPFLVDYRGPSLENVERVELFRGPSALINGAGESSAAGGTINLVTKRAADRPMLRFDGGYSSDLNFEGHLDGGRRFIGDGILGLRGQLGGRYGDTPIDNQKDTVSSASLEADVRTTKLRASVDATDQYRGLLAERGSLYILPGFAVPQTPRLTSNLFDRSTTFHKHQAVVLAHAEYDPATPLELYGSYGYTVSPETYEGPYYPTITDAAGDVTLYDIPYWGHDVVHSGRIGGRLKFTTGPLSHQITLNGDLVHDRSAYFNEFLNAFTTNIYQPIPLAPLTSHTAPIKPTKPTQGYDLHSFAAADVVTGFGGRLVLIGGVREQSIQQHSFGSFSKDSGGAAVFTPCASACLYDKSALSPSGAGLFRITSRISLYANYIQDLQQGPTAPIGAVNFNQIFPPSKAQQEEAGAKFELAHAGATLSYFRITEPLGVLNPVTQVFGLTGQQRNSGVELTYFGNPFERLRLIGGVTFLSARQQNTGDANTNDKTAQGVPVAQMTEGAEFSVPHVKRLVLTGRVTASSGQFADTAETQRVPAWARLDLGGRYTLPVRYEPTLRVNFDNVSGHDYWESGLQGISYGAPRALRISTGFRF